ncbi:MAG TPA: gamma-glutamyl-gamma-aminobutyrate hydrolase family protein [Gemmatimonadaceae bacterium]|nr:gamma-glutamyl-gamma-aminobutyrate hydrolase family protein [Gemmatimonadaceae bacterium]
MTARPIIGITTQTLEAIPGELPRCWVMSQRYVNVLTSVGAVPWVIPLTHDMATLREIYDRLDGVFLPGGVDMDPATYGEAKLPVCGATDADRDRVEIALVQWAMAERKPLLAVCRGVQVLNVAAGGTLYQDLQHWTATPIKHDYWPSDGNHRDDLVHDIRVEDGTELAAIMGGGTSTVNSMHHQGIKRLAPSLVANAYAPDGLIEGVEGRDDGYLLGVQWHPEELVEQARSARRLFESFIEAAAAHEPEVAAR